MDIIGIVIIVHISVEKDAKKRREKWITSKLSYADCDALGNLLHRETSL